MVHACGSTPSRSLLLCNCLPSVPAACVCYVRVLGSPIYSFQLERQQAQQQQQAKDDIVWKLAYCPRDPLQAAGGLVAVSEGGRLAHEEGEEDSESGLEDDESDLSRCGC